MISYKKEPKTTQEHIDLLKARDLIINDNEDAKSFLKYCSYYRFSGYSFAFECTNSDSPDKRSHIFKPNTKFNDIVQLYKFDRELRHLIFRYIGYIEIFFRTTFVNLTSLKYNTPDWFIIQEYFKDGDHHSDFIEKCKNEFKKNKECFISKFKSEHQNEVLPPLWMLIEIMTFATWSKAYKNLKDEDGVKREIAKEFKIKPFLLESWLEALTFLRNSCAHHSRIWNKYISKKLSLSERIKRIIDKKDCGKISNFIVIIFELLKPINYHDNFKNDILNLLKEKDPSFLKQMGITHPIEEYFN